MCLSDRLCAVGVCRLACTCVGCVCVCVVCCMLYVYCVYAYECECEYVCICVLKCVSAHVRVYVCIFAHMQGCVIRSFGTFNTVKYALNMIRCTMRIRRMTHPCMYV